MTFVTTVDTGSWQGMDGKNVAQGTKENHRLSVGIIGLHITCTADSLCELLEICEFLLIT